MLRQNSLTTKLLSLILTVVLFSAPLFSCSDDEPKDIGDDTVCFVDALGRELTVDKNPERVASLIGSFADLWVLAGGELCAAAEDAWDDFGLEQSTAINLGGAHSPSLEALISADPDLVIASASSISNVELKDSLESMGITVAYFDVDCFDDYLSVLKICTDITGRSDLYQKNGLDIKDQIDKIVSEAALRGIPDDQRSVLLLRASSGSVKAKSSKGTILGEMLSDFGLTNIADSDSSLLENLSVESVIRSDPYRIFAVTMGDDTDAALDNLRRMMSENPAWEKLDAVKNGRVHVMDKKLFNLKPNVKWALSYEELSKIIFNNGQ